MSGYKKLKNVCPVNCPSSCTIISHVNNNHLVHITGDPTHPYTKGKLCSKGLSFVEKNFHSDRLKFPYYQEVKGSGKFKQITWEKAFDLIVNELINIHRRYGNFLPLALYKGSGNLGIHHFVAEEFFCSLGETSKMIKSKYQYSNLQALQLGTGQIQISDPSNIKESSMIVIWGTNPAATNIHIIPDLLEANARGAKLVVIDPIYTQTAELADLYIQIKPGTDGALANVLIKKLIEMDLVDSDFIEKSSDGFDSFARIVQSINIQEYLSNCGISNKAIDILLEWFNNSKTVSYFIGSGIGKHGNGSQTIRCIEALAAAHGDIGKKGGGIFLYENPPKIFNNQRSERGKNRLVPMDLQYQKNLNPPIELLWITCGNPLNQNANSSLVNKILKNTPFVVTVDHFLTSTANMSNLILPTTTQFEEIDIILNSWHKEIALNEQSILPYYHCRSEWNIMNELANRINQYKKGVCTFPIYSSEEEYLNSQFNDLVFDLYNIHSVTDMKEKKFLKNVPKIAWSDLQFATESKKFQFYTTPIYKEGRVPSEDFPFWLITSHHPYMLNTQFHYLHLAVERDAYVEINSTVAKKLDIRNGEVIKVFNDQATVEIKALYSQKVPKDILLIYTGSYPNMKVNVNHLVSSVNVGKDKKEVAFYDTFVNISKW